MSRKKLERAGKCSILTLVMCDKGKLMRQMTINIGRNCFFLILLMSASCGLDSRSPAEVVESAYMAANAGEYSKANEYLSAEARSAAEGALGALVGGTKGIWDKMTRNGEIDRIEILEEKIRGEGAEVRFKIHFKDGRTKDDDEPLIKEDGKWKITVG